MAVTPPTADLRTPDHDPWSDLDVPPGWEPIAKIAERVAMDLPRRVGTTLRHIAEEIPPYRDEDAVPPDDLRQSVERNLEMMLIGIAEHRGPTAEEVAVRRELGARRAIQGVPIDALIQAYHVGYRELWQTLVREVPPEDKALTTQLLTAATTVWQWIHEVTTAIAEAYGETVRSREAHVTGARQRFTELVIAGDLGGDEIRQLATAVGFDPHGTFVAAVTRPESVDGSEARQLQRRLGRSGGIHAAVQRGPVLVIVSQGVDTDAVVEAVQAVVPGAPLGVGAPRAGLDGARDSLGDAERAVALSFSGPVRFEEAWLWATVLRAGHRLEPVLSDGVRVAAEHPHLAETVRVFADSGFSVSEAARHLELHANTVSYRLERWHQLTGWDPRGFDGLTRSLAATLLFERS